MSGRGLPMVACFLQKIKTITFVGQPPKQSLSLRHISLEIEQENLSQHSSILCCH